MDLGCEFIAEKIAEKDFSLEREAQALNELYKDLLTTSTLLTYLSYRGKNL
jgi:hypothetical protein